jgi:mono/diheme cytochrome c family protein
MFKLSLSFLALACLVSSLSCAGPATTNSVNTAGSNAAMANARSTPASTPAIDDLAKGQKLYVDNCSKCHKDDGTGGEVVVEGRKMKADNLTDDKRKKLSDDKILKVMVDGIEDEGMPSFKDKMSEAEMREVVRYIRVELQKMPGGPPISNSVAQR